MLNSAEEAKILSVPSRYRGPPSRYSISLTLNWRFGRAVALATPVAWLSALMQSLSGLSNSGEEAPPGQGVLAIAASGTLKNLNARGTQVTRDCADVMRRSAAEHLTTKPKSKKHR